MTRLLELRLVDAGGPRKPVEGVVPGQRVPPFVEEHIDGLVLPHAVVEPDDEAFPPADALSEDRVRKSGHPDDDGQRGGASAAEVGERGLEVGPAGAGQGRRGPDGWRASHGGGREGPGMGSK